MDFDWEFKEIVMSFNKICPKCLKIINFNSFIKKSLRHLSLSISPYV